MKIFLGKVFGNRIYLYIMKLFGLYNNVISDKNLLDADIMRKLLSETDYSLYTNTKGGKFWGNSGAGVLPICVNTGKILVPLRSKYVNEPRTYGIFGGKTDNDETPEHAAKRELVEEAGYHGNYKLIPAYVYKSSDNTFTYYNFIGLVEEEFKPILDWETEAAQWITFEELINLKPKHFGLESLIANSGDLIKKYTEN